MTEAHTFTAVIVALSIVGAVGISWAGAFAATRRTVWEARCRLRIHDAHYVERQTELAHAETFKVERTASAVTSYAEAINSMNAVLNTPPPRPAPGSRPVAVEPPPGVA